MITTLKFLLFVSVFATVSGLLVNSIQPVAIGGVINASGSSGSLYVMKDTGDYSSYTKTRFGLNTSSDIQTAVDFYFYADHDNTKYTGALENFFTLYVNMVNLTTGDNYTLTFETVPIASTSATLSNFGIPSDLIRGVNSGWDVAYTVSVNVKQNVAAVGSGSVYWIVPISVSLTGPPSPPWVLLAALGAVGLAFISLPAAIVAGVGILTLESGAAIIASNPALSAFVSTLGQVLTMDFPGLPVILRLSLMAPIWFCIGYIVLIVVRSFLPLIGGGSWG